MILWYDKLGKPFPDTDKPSDSKEWREAMGKVEALLRNPEYKVIKQDKTKREKFFVSTVWLGVDHDFHWMGSDPNPHPVIFETMIFTQDQGSGRTEAEDLDMSQWRYSTEAEARQGHRKALRYAQAAEDSTMAYTLRSLWLRIVPNLQVMIIIALASVPFVVSTVWAVMAALK